MYNYVMSLPNAVILALVWLFFSHNRSSCLEVGGWVFYKKMTLIDVHSKVVEE